METEFSFPMFLLKFEEPVNLMDEIGQRFQKPLRLIGNLSVVLGVLGMLLATVVLTKGLFTVLNGGPAQVGLVIPGVRIPGSPVFIPLLEGLVAILLLAIFHEGMHGLMAAAEGIRPKYAALLLLLFVPAAGVELDEDKLKKKSKLSRLRIFSAGSLGNFILALLCIGLLIPAGTVAANFIDNQGLTVLNSTNLNIPEGAVITGVNGAETLSLEELHSTLEGLVPGAVVEVETTEGTFSGNLTDEGKLGVYLQPEFTYRGLAGQVFGFIARVLSLSVQLNIGVGLINLFPLGIMDGGRMLALMTERGYKWLSPLALAILLANLVGPYLL